MCYVGLCVIDIYSEYAWVIPLKDRKGIKAVSFTIDQWDQFFRIMIWKCFQCIMKENLLLLKDSLEL